MGEREVIERFPKEPITESRIAMDLGVLGLKAGMTVLVHSSLSEIGWVCGGAAAVTSALRSTVRAFGNVVMPTHTGGLCDPSTWEAPPVPESWWEPIRGAMPPFDPETTPSQGMGAIPEFFRSMPDVYRSRHPHYSFAAWGERAVDIVSGHPLDFGMGEGSPLSRVYDLDGSVLLLGVDFDRNTSFHLSEYRARYSGREEVERFAPVMMEGHRRWKKLNDINIDSSDFAQIGRDFVRSDERAALTGRVGNASATLFLQRAAVDFAVRWIEKNRR